VTSHTKAFPPNFHHLYLALSRQRGNSREGQPFFLWVVKIRLGSGILSPVVAHVQYVTQRQRIINMRRQYVDPSRIFFVCSQLIFELKSIIAELYPNWLIIIDCVASR
jgi:hypothetical protein